MFFKRRSAMLSHILFLCCSQYTLVSFQEATTYTLCAFGCMLFLTKCFEALSTFLKWKKKIQRKEGDTPVMIYAAFYAWRSQNILLNK